MGNKILLAEDSKTQAEYLKMLLESEGYTVVSADDGQIAKEKLQSFIPDLIISDIVMPRVNGYELCRYVKTNPELSSIPFVILTALDSAEDLLRGLEVGADNFIRKPFQEQYLLTRIARIFNNIYSANHESLDKPIEIEYSGNKITLNTNTIHTTQIVELLLSMVEDLGRQNNDFKE